MPHGVEDLLFHDTNNVPDHTSWRSSEDVWHLDNSTIDHQATDHFGYLAEQLFTGTSGDDYPQATSLNISSEEWPDLAPDTAWAKHMNPNTPSIATLYPPTPQESLATSPETLVPNKREGEKGVEPLSPVSPESPDEGPTSQKKRKRNRVAAAKCRKKAKRGLDELQQRERDLLSENRLLSVQACVLRDEVIELRNEILRHSKCDNNYIQQYIQRAAEQVGGAPSKDSTGAIPVVLSATR
ncbi:hypothetical protein HD806DRAFT_538275 [Xylariaceae sp. AK1471]|nr:hypothetical protein HD806DRAFT_538275 [Xylariaceae sp. AK1471]